MAPVYDQWARCYDLLEGDRTDMVNFFTSMVSPQTESLLELGCGTGVITTAMARQMATYHGGRAGVRVAGLDESVEMLEIARARDPEIEWILGDFRAPTVTCQYDLIIAPFNVLQMILEESDLSRVFRAARERLNSDGEFIIDIYQPNIAYLSVPQADRLVRRVKDDRGRTLELREDFVYDPRSQILTLDWRMVEPGNDRALMSMHYCLRQYFASELIRLLSGARLAVKERYGDYDRRAFTPESKKQIVLCGPG